MTVSYEAILIDELCGPDHMARPLSLTVQITIPFLIRCRRRGKLSPNTAKWPESVSNVQLHRFRCLFERKSSFHREVEIQRFEKKH